MHFVPTTPLPCFASRSKLSDSSLLKTEEKKSQHRLSPQNRRSQSAYCLTKFRPQQQSQLTNFMLLTLLFAVLQQNDGAASRVQERCLQPSQHFSPPAVCLAWMYCDHSNVTLGVLDWLSQCSKAVRLNTIIYIFLLKYTQLYPQCTVTFPCPALPPAFPLFTSQCLPINLL